MTIRYQYPDGSRGGPKPFGFDGCIQSASYLAPRDGETDAAWAARLATVGATPIRVTPSEADPNLFDAGDPVETMGADGVITISYPAPIAKTPVWSTSTREPMHISAGADVPPGYTATEPPFGAYSTWDDVADDWAEDTDRMAAQARTQAQAELAAIDAATIRPLRAVLAAQQAGNDPDPADVAMLADLEAQAQAVRATL